MFSFIFLYNGIQLFSIFSELIKMFSKFIFIFQIIIFIIISTCIQKSIIESIKDTYQSPFEISIRKKINFLL